jgi:glycosyltransferase involved in cell wall biosynthesis
LEVAGIVDRFDVVAARGRIDRLMAAAGAGVACLHSIDWSRQTMPQLWVLALARSRVGDLHLVDEASSATPRPIRRAGARDALAAGTQIAAGALRAAVEAQHILQAGKTAIPPGGREPRSVVAVWPGSLAASVGGSTSHAAGVLGAFRRRGLRVILVTAFEPPPQLAAAVDEIEVLDPTPASWRVSSDVERLSINRRLRLALPPILDRAVDPFLYSRHQALIHAPAEAAAGRGVPLVLEWNASERWALSAWTRNPSVVKRVTIPLVGAVERVAVAGSTVLAAVSSEASRMAIEAGAAPSRLVTVPNAVDVEAVDRAVAEARDNTGGGDGRAGSFVVGWVGTFGDWHGAEVLIEALAKTAAETRLLMIGEGSSRSECEARSAELGISGRVEFAGRLPHEAALARLAGCDVLACPTVPLRGGEPFFGSPTKLFEYMALERPIVASELGQIAEILEDGRNALLSEPGDADGLAAALVRLRESPELGRRLAREARTDAEARHGWSNRAEEILAALSAA